MEDKYKDLYNATGQDITFNEKGKPTVKRPAIGTIIYVNTGVKSEAMLVDSYEGNRICCDHDGIEKCVALTIISNTLLWKDITE